MTIASHSPTPVSVVSALYLRTKTLHAEAEKTGIIRDILRGAASREGYLLFLRNLLPAYREMENGLERHQRSPGLDRLAPFRLARAPAIESDLIALSGADWSSRIPLLASGEAYARRIATAAEGSGARLIAHAYARYLGDLSGGLILQRLLAKTLGLQPDQLMLYDFSGFADPAALKADYRQALEQAGAALPDHESIIEEGAVAFSLNIDLSLDVKSRMDTAAVGHALS